MIGYGLGPVSRAVRRRVPAVAATIAYIGASNQVAVDNTVATMTLPSTAQAGDIVVMATSAAGSNYVSSSPAGSVEAVTGAPRVRVVRMLGGETTVSMTHSASTGLRARAMMFRPSLKNGFTVNGTFSSTTTNPAISASVASLPAIAIFAGTHTGTATGNWLVTLPSGTTSVENTAYSAAARRALFLGYKILSAGETNTGNFTSNVSGTSSVSYVAAVIPS